MHFHELYHRVSALAVAHAAPTDDTAIVGEVVDHLGAETALYLIHTGALATALADFSILLEHGDQPDLSDAEEVPARLILGSEFADGFTGENDDATISAGLIPEKRYSRLTITPAGNTGAAPIAAMAILARQSAPNTV